MILIDNRVGSKELMRYMPQGAAELTRLQYADAMWLGNGPQGTPVHIGVELKSVGDMLNCITDGRFSGHQLPGLLRDYHVVYLIIEGKYRPCPDTGRLQVQAVARWKDISTGTKHWMYRDLDCFLTSIEAIAGVKVRRVYDRHEAAVTIRNLHHWWTDKTFNEHRSTYAFDQSGDPLLTVPSTMRRIAAQLPGIGWTRSHLAEAHFDGIEPMIFATEKEWRAVPGIGATIAKRVVAEIQKRKTRR